MPSLGGIKAGNAFIVLGVIDNTTKMLARIGRNFRAWGARFQSMGQNLFFQTGLALTPAVLGLNTYIKYDDVLKRIQGRNNSTTKSMEDMSDEARATAKSLGYSAKEIAQIMDEFAQRGFDDADIMSMTRPTAKLARAAGPGSELDTKQAADVMSTTLRAFRLSSKEADHVANVFALAANKGNFALNDFVEAMSKVAPMASEMGLTLEQTVAILSQLRDVGIEAETAGYSLRNILLEAIDTKKVDAFNEALKDLTGQTIKFSDEFGNLRNVVDIISEIGIKTAKLGTGTRTNLLNDLFGKRAVLSALVISRTTQGIEELTAELKNVGDEAGRVAGIMNSGLGGTFRRLTSTIEGLAISLGDTLNLALQGTEKYINPLLDSTAKWIMENKALVVGISTAAISLFGISAALVTLGITFKVTAFAIGTLVNVLSLFGLITSTVTAAIALMGMTVTTVTGIINGAVAIAGVVITTFSLIASAAVGLFGAVMAVFDGIAMLGAFMGFTFGALPSILIIVGALTIMGTVVYVLVEQFGFLKNEIDAATGSFLRFIDSFKTDVAGYFTTLSAAANSAFATIKTGFMAAFNSAAIGDWANAAKIGLSTVELAWLKLEVAVKQIWRNLMSDMTAYFLKFDQFLIASANKAANILRMVSPAAFMLMGKDHFGVPLSDADIADVKKLLDMGNAVFNGMDMDVLNKKAKEHEGNIHQGIIDAWLKDADKKAGIALPGKPPGQPGQPGTSPVPDVMAALKPLQGLEFGTLEAAKAGYEHSLTAAGGQAGDKQVRVLNQIADNTAIIAENLQVA